MPVTRTLIGTGQSLLTPPMSTWRMFISLRRRCLCEQGAVTLMHASKEAKLRTHSRPRVSSALISTSRANSSAVPMFTLQDGNHTLVVPCCKRLLPVDRQYLSWRRLPHCMANLVLHHVHMRYWLWKGRTRQAHVAPCAIHIRLCNKP